MEEKTGFAATLYKGLLTGSLFGACTAIIFCIAGGISQGWSQGMLYCITLLVAGIACGILQQLWFSWEKSLRLVYPTRLVGFGLTYYLILAACAFWGNWLPVYIVGAWVVFTIIYLVILCILSLIIGRSLSKRGIEYKAKLEEYQAKAEDRQD